MLLLRYWGGGVPAAAKELQGIASDFSHIARTSFDDFVVLSISLSVSLSLSLALSLSLSLSLSLCLSLSLSLSLSHKYICI